MQIYPPEEWTLLFHAVINPNVYWDTNVLNFTAAKYYEYGEWIEQFGCWAGTAKHFIHTMNFKALYLSLSIYITGLHVTKAYPYSGGSVTTRIRDKGDNRLHLYCT